MSPSPDKSKKKSSKHRKDSSSSSESDSESDKSNSSSSSAHSSTKEKQKKYTKSTKSSSKRDHSSSDESEKNVKGRKDNSSRWDSPENENKSKIRHTSDDENNVKKSYDRRDRRRNSRDRNDRNRNRERSYENRNRERDRSNENRSRGKDRSCEDRSRDRRDRADVSRSRAYYDNKRLQRRERSPFDKDSRRNNSDKYRDSKRKRSESPNNANYTWGKQDQDKNDSSKQSDNPPLRPEKEKPNFGLSGKLTEETNTYKGVVIKYSEPTDARKPKRRWRLYPFKGEKAMQTLYIHRQSAYLIGRDRKIADLPIDHPSCSKQHAVLQYRLVPFERDDGSTGKRVRPYIIDLESANGTFINNNRIDPKKYVELLEKDVIKFGYSSREYVLLHENSKDEALDDDVKLEDEDFGIKQERKD